MGQFSVTCSSVAGIELPHVYLCNENASTLAVAAACIIIVGCEYSLNIHMTYSLHRLSLIGEETAEDTAITPSFCAYLDIPTVLDSLIIWSNG